MIKDKIIARRYADAYMAFVRQNIGMEKAIAELKDLKNVVIHENPGFLEFLTHEGMGHNEKREFVERVLNDNFSHELKNFLKLLLDKERISHLLDIMEYIRVTYSYGDEVEALLKTSFPLDVDLIRDIETRLQEKLHKKLKFYIDLDADLLGGIQVVIGDHAVIDGSVKRRLEDLKDKLRRLKV